MTLDDKLDLAAREAEAGLDNISVARDYLARAQNLAEFEDTQGQAFFVLGCAVKRILDELEARRD